MGAMLQGSASTLLMSSSRYLQTSQAVRLRSNWLIQLTLFSKLGVTYLSKNWKQSLLRDYIDKVMVFVVDIQIQFINQTQPQPQASPSNCPPTSSLLPAFHIINMSEQRRNEILEQFRRPQGNKSSRSKDVKNRLHQLRSKETFLTDTQTSDYTKSSGEINLSRTEQLEETVRKLERENGELKQRIVELKTSQFFEINEEKVKGILKETERLRQELDRTRKDLEQSMVERDFLERFNRNLKAQCEAFTKELLLLKGAESKKNEKSIYLSRDESQTSKNRNSSNDLQLPVKKKEGVVWKKEKEESGTQDNRSMLKTSLSASRLHEDYYSGRTSRHKPFRNN